MNNFWEKLEDKLNPILFKDLRKTVRSREFWPQVIFLIFVYICLYVILIIDDHQARDYINTCLRVLGFISLVASVVIPLELRKLSINEVNDENKDGIYYIFMTNVTASKFIMGKLALGFFYAALLFISAIPIYLYVYFSKAIDAYRLIRLFYYSCIAPLPHMIFFIHEGVVDGVKNKASIYVNGAVNLFGQLIFGFMFLSLLVVEGIRDINYLEITPIIVLDIVLSFVNLVASILTYLLLYSVIIKKYPMSEISSAFVFRARKVISFKYEKKDIEKTSIVEEKPKSQNILNTENKTDNFNNEKLINKPTQIKSNRSDKDFNPLPIDDEAPELKLYKTRIKSRKEEKYSTETITKIFITILWFFCLILIYFKSVINMLIIFLFYLLFPYLVSYFLSREKKYDNRSKLEIPDSDIKKIIKFPFVSGYVSGFIWVSMLCVLFLIGLLLTYGIYEIKPGVVYYSRDVFYGGYFVVMGFMLNIFSWCSIGRIIAELFLKEDTKENKVFASSVFLLLGTAFCSGFLPKETPLSLLNYFVPNMPMFIDYNFFNTRLAFVLNLFFFIITIIPNLKSLYEQTTSYFSKQ